MARLKKSKNKNKKKSATAKTEKQLFPSVVGPDLFLLLQGRLFDDDGADDNSGRPTSGGGKNVSLILCGESHNDAIDVTRRSPPGKFDATEGWIQIFDSSQQEDDENDILTALPRTLLVPSRRDQTRNPRSRATVPTLSIENLALRYLHPVNGKKNKAVTLDKARELASAFVEKYEIEDDMYGSNLILLWIATNGSSDRTEKGEGFLLEIETEVEMDDFENDPYDNSDDSESEDDSETYDDWVFFSSDDALLNNHLQQRNRYGLPHLVAQWIDDIMMVVRDDDSTAKTIDDVIDYIHEDGKTDDSADCTSENGSVTIPSRHRRLMHARLGRYVLLEYGDLDPVAHDMLKRRLGMTDAEVTSNEYDDVIETRKQLLKDEDNVWTFDDWFEHVKAGGTKSEKDTIPNDARSDDHGMVGIDDLSVHLVLEASVPPWEVELHRPRVKVESTDNEATASTIIVEAEEYRLHPASQSVRCLSEDSSASWEDETDPSSDGIGSYVDYIYRKVMSSTKEFGTNREKEKATGVIEKKKIEDVGLDSCDGSLDISTIVNETIDHKKAENVRSNWLHCIDMRDLGCEAACHAESVKQEWYELMTQEERGILSNPKDVAKDACPVNKKGDTMRFLPAYKLNPEWIEMERLKSEGLLVQEEDDTEPESEYERDKDLLEFTFPSFEGFFGGISDILYYNPNVKVAYSPFIFHCVRSLDNWKAFFTALFFGGTIPEALEMLDLRAVDSRNCVHIRSPIHQEWDPQSNSYTWKERDEEECYITCPFFPFAFHLVAKGSSPPRTWSSQLFANLCDSDQEQCEISHHHSNSRRNLALAIKSWILHSIHRNMEDPKGSDDKECGGEWFASYLRATHRDIYDDIDTSDAAVLLQKSHMKSISGSRLKKYNIGKIRMPSIDEGFEEILARFRERESIPHYEKIVTPRVEVFAQILIDIWISNLFDYSLLLKIANICAKESKDNIVVVCYVGSAHAKAASNFFCEKLGFQRKEMVGKFSWDEDELQTLDLPSNLWNFPELFRR